MGKLKEFIDENINWEGTKATVPAGHIVTEAVVMFRLVKNQRRNWRTVRAV